MSLRHFITVFLKIIILIRENKSKKLKKDGDCKQKRGLRQKHEICRNRVITFSQGVCLFSDFFSLSGNQSDNVLCHVAKLRTLQMN